MELIALNKQIPLRSIPESTLDDILQTQFKYFISRLINIKSDNDTIVNDALPAIKEHCWSMGLHEIVKMFQMYADSKLDIEPKTNYFDRILVGHVYMSYRRYKKANEKHVYKPFNKDERDIIYCIQYFDYLKDNEYLPDNAIWLYDYLTEYKSLVKFDKKEKISNYNLMLERFNNEEIAIEQSKLRLIERYFNQLYAKEQHIKDLL